MSGNEIATTSDWVPSQPEEGKPTENCPSSFRSTTVALLLSEEVQSPTPSPTVTVGRYTSQGMTKLRRLYSAAPGSDSNNKLINDQFSPEMSTISREIRAEVNRLSRGPMGPQNVSHGAPRVVDKATQLSRRSTAIIPSMVDKGVNVSGKMKERTPHPSAVYIGKHPTKSWPLHPGWLVIAPEVFNKDNWPMSKEKLPTIKTTFTRGKRIYKRLHQNGLINSETAVDFYNYKGWPRRRPVFITARMLVEDSSGPTISHAGLNEPKDSSMQVSCADSIWNFIKLVSGATKKVLDSCYGGVVQMFRQCLATANSVAAATSSSDERGDSLGYDTATTEESDWNFTCLRQPIEIQQLPPRYYVEKRREPEPPRWPTTCTPTVVTDPSRSGTPITCGTIKELASRYGLTVTHVDGCWTDDSRRPRRPVTADSSDATTECQFSCDPPQQSRQFDSRGAVPARRPSSPVRREAGRKACVPTPTGCVARRQPGRDDSIGSFVISLSGRSRTGNRSPERRRKCQPKTKCIPTARGCLTPSNITKVFDLKSEESYPFDTVVDTTSGSIISDKRRIAEILFDTKRKCSMTPEGCFAARKASSRGPATNAVPSQSMKSDSMSSGVRPRKPPVLGDEFAGIGTPEVRSQESKPLSLDREFALDDQPTKMPQEPRREAYPSSDPRQNVTPTNEYMPPREYVPRSVCIPHGSSYPCTPPLPPCAQPGAGSAPPRDTIPPADGIPVRGAVPPRDGVPVREAMPPRQTIPPAEGMPPRQTVPPTERTLPRESINNSPRVTFSPGPPTATIIPRESSSGVDSAPSLRENMPEPTESTPPPVTPPPTGGTPPSGQSTSSQKESIPQTQSFPSTESVAPTRESAPPPKESTPYGRETVPPTRESAPPPRESIPHGRETVPPPRESAPPTRESAPPTRESAPPPRETVPPTRESAPPPRESIPHGRETVPPTRESAPPPRESIPHGRETVPPTRESAPPPRESIPHGRETVPPPRQSAPPPRESIPSARESVPPPRQSAPPPRDGTAPARESIPAARESATPARQSATPHEASPAPDQHNAPRPSDRDRPSRNPFGSVGRAIDDIYGNTDPSGGQPGMRSMSSDRPRGSRVSSSFGNRETPPDQSPPSRRSRGNEDFGSRGGYSGSESRPRPSRTPRVSTRFGVREGQTSGGETTNPDEGRGSRYGVFPVHSPPGKENENSPQVMYVRICLDKDKRTKSPRHLSSCDATRARIAADTRNVDRCTEVNDSHFPRDTSCTENAIRDLEMRDNCGVVFRDSCDKAVNVNWTSNSLKNYCNVGGPRYRTDTRFRDDYVDGRQQYAGSANRPCHVAAASGYNEGSRTASSRNSDTPWESCSSVLSSDCPSITPIIRLTEIPRRGDCCQASIRTPNGRWHKVNIMRPWEDNSTSEVTSNNHESDHYAAKSHGRECGARW